MFKELPYGISRRDNLHPFIKFHFFQMKMNFEKIFGIHLQWMYKLDYKIQCHAHDINDLLRIMIFDLYLNKQKLKRSHTCIDKYFF